MFGWYKMKKFYPVGTVPRQWWDRKYEDDGEQRSDEEEYQRQLFYPLLMKYMKPGRRYLDAGCGLGGWLAFLRARGMDMVGIENSEKAVEAVKNKNPQLPIQLGDVSHLPFNNESLDGYMALGTWEYVEDGTETLAQEARRVLKPGGMLFIEVPYANPFRRLTYLPLKSLQVALRALLGQKPVFINYLFRKGDIKEVLTSHGFEILEMIPHDLPDEKSHYGLWIDWPFVRGRRPYELNALGLVVKKLMNSASPWMIPTGMFFVAKKK
ncbi:MAG: class I SAM-dependent methyltransferase [Candidatus Andersenbacteria bacterium]